jgi:tetratricopeptide (TPR) repeat protein
MAVKRVTDSYARGIQAIANARRPPQSQGARAAMPKPVSPRHMASKTPPVAPVLPPPDVAREAGADAIANIAVDISRLQLAAKPPSEHIAPVDYHDIVANTIATLDNSTVEARHAVYECARQVVYQRLMRIRPALTADLIERERLSLDLAIERIETAARKTQPPSPAAVPASEPEPAPQAMAPVVITAPRRNLAHAKHFHGGALRLFGMTALVCAGMFGYWLATGKPEIGTAVTYLHKLPMLPHATNADPVPQSARADLASATLPNPTSDNDRRAAEDTARDTASADTVATVKSLASNPLISLNVTCDSPPCSSTADFTDTDPNRPSWIAAYGSLTPTRPATPRTPFGKPSTGGRQETASRSTAPPTAAGYYERGLEQAKGGDPEQAIREFSDAIKADPNFSDAYLQRGNMLFKNGNPDRAIEDFRAAVRVEPRNAAAFKSRGMALLYKGAEDQSLDDLTRAIEITEADPTRLSVLDLFFARRSRAALFERKQLGERELFDLTAMIDAYWKNPDLAAALKVNYGTQGAGAVMASIYRQRANIYLQRANFDGAIADLSFALQLDAQRALALTIDRARVQEAAGRRDQAAADYQRVLDINPRFDEAKQALARLRERS